MKEQGRGKGDPAGTEMCWEKEKGTREWVAVKLRNVAFILRMSVETMERRRGRY